MLSIQNKLNENFCSALKMLMLSFKLNLKTFNSGTAKNNKAIKCRS